MVTIKCVTCGVVFGLDDNQYERLLACGNNLFCPNGHEQHFGKAERENVRLTEENATLTRRYEYFWGLYQWNKDLLIAERKSNAALRGVITKLKKQIAALKGEQ